MASFNVSILFETPPGHLLQSGLHGSTFGGNPLACRVAYTVLDLLDKQYLATIADKGYNLLDLLQSRLTGLQNIQSVRGAGLMIGIELIHPVANIPQLASEKFGVLLNVTQGKVIRLLPPLIMTDAQVEYLAQQIALLLKELSQNYVESQP